MIVQIYFNPIVNVLRTSKLIAFIFRITLMYELSINMADEDINSDDKTRKISKMSTNPFEMSDDEDADLSALHDTGNERTDNDFRESTASRDTTSFYDTIEDNDSKYYSSKSNM